MKARFITDRFNVAMTLLATTIYVSAQIPIQIPGLYNTGVDSAGTVLSQLSLEQHYTVTGPVSIPYVVPPVYNPALGWAWAAAPAGSAWIGPNSTTNTSSADPVGLYRYTLQFDLTGFDSSAVRISGTWMSDNTAELFLNGINTGFSKDNFGYNHLDSFTLNTGFLPAINSLEFRVLNEDVGPNPTGLVVAGLAAVLIPEPATCSLILIGVSGVYLRKRLVQRD